MLRILLLGFRRRSMEGGRRWRVCNGDGKGFPVLRSFEKLPSIQHQPGMAFKMLVRFPHTALELNRQAGATAKPVERQRTRETVSFLVIWKQRQPTIHIVDHIFHGVQISARCHRIVGQPAQQPRKADHSQGKTGYQYHQSRFHDHAIFSGGWHTGQSSKGHREVQTIRPSIIEWGQRGELSVKIRTVRAGVLLRG
jgi:hypothetical protein